MTVDLLVIWYGVICLISGYEILYSTSSGEWLRGLKRYHVITGGFFLPGTAFALIVFSAYCLWCLLHELFIKLSLNKPLFKD